ncbi:MAG TPA: Uma2 family endonuclease [Thermoanaerobaculia bacterium]
MAEPLRNTPADWESEPTSSPGADPFPYGWRIRHVRLPSGEVAEQQIPLTPEDLLDPQLGDVVVQSVDHYWEAHDVAGPLRDHYASREDVLVASDVKLLWGIQDLKEPAPDVAVIFGIRDKKAERESFNCVAEGTRPSLVIEVVSSKDAEVRRNDYVDKVRIYEQAGVPEYIILDPPSRLTKNRFLLTGYRLEVGGKYQPIQPDPKGFLLSKTTNLLFGAAEDGQTLQVIDAATGERLLTSLEVKEAQQREAEARKQAEERAAQETARRKEAEERAEAAEAETARLRAELERYRGQ